MKLDPDASTAGVRLIERDRVGSTNTEALTLARAGERSPLWLVARAQTAGRGRRGRTWVSEPGNLYASLLLVAPVAPDRVAELSFVAALAVRDAIASIPAAKNHALTLKWPNDVLIDGRKFAGILIEGEGATVVVGIGINCVHHPQTTMFPATDLAAMGVSVTAEEVFLALSAAMQRRLEQWDHGAGFAAIRRDWLAHAAMQGETVSISLPDGVRMGLFETVDVRGHLVLRLANGSRQTIAAGDVSGFRHEGDRPAAVEH